MNWNLVAFTTGGLLIISGAFALWGWPAASIATGLISLAAPHWFMRAPYHWGGR